jgi:hypothetical protein
MCKFQMCRYADEKFTCGCPVYTLFQITHYIFLPSAHLKSAYLHIAN